MAGTRTLQQRHVRLEVVVPSGTAKATPQSTSWNLGRVVVDQIDLRVPPGPSGLAGLAILYAGVPIIPSEQPGTFFVGDDEAFSWPLTWEISGPFTVQTYNTDIYPHTLYLTAHVRDLVLVQPGTTQAGAVVTTTIAVPADPSEAELAAAVATVGAP